jgi:dihydroorotase
MAKIMAPGSSLEDLIRISTINPASQIKRPQLGNLSQGAEADVAILR